MKRLHHLYVYALIFLVPILLLLYLGSVEADVYAASPRQQPAYLTVGVSPIGSGTVDKDPDQLSYEYGDVVTLTVTANLGWTFDSWSGDLTGSDNPITLTMDSDKTVTATLTQDEYTLTVGVSPIGSGSVDKDPDQATYHYGEVVTLTATANPGWTFDSWSGDLTGSDNPKALTMDGDKTVTATLTQEVYTLTVGVSPIGSGSVGKDPDQATYNYGEVVTLTVTANPGWTFIEWSGDLTGSDNPETLVMDDDKTVTATLQNLSDINIWYGSHQVFGHIGIPQPWINILGNVSDPDGVYSLTYSLNGGPELPLSIGPDTRRLEFPGDFNVDIAYADLNPGLNQVVIAATDLLYNTAVETVTVEYVDGNVWPAPYSIDWSSVVTIPSVAQVVDGLWTKEGDSIRTLELGYDRAVAIGDMTWDDYEVTVPLTIHDMSASDGGAGILMRWEGHTDDPVSGWQPKSGWLPLGAIGWFRYNRLEFWGNNDEIIATDYSQTPVTGLPYIFKMRVETIPGEGGLYSLKVWEDGQPEPSEWDLIAQEELSDPQDGSMLLLAHNWEASFGDVTITPGPLPDTVQPIISNIQVTLGETWATVTWTTNELATSSVAYGPSAAYENGSVTDNTLVTEHSITLTDLFQGALYHYQISSADEHDNVARSTDLTFRTAGVGSSIVSDDFNTCGLNIGLWEFIDPRADGTYAMMGTFTEDAWLSISVPAGTGHDIWTDGNFAPRIMQPANDVDFQIEVKFESEMSEQYQMQGVLIEQDSNDFLRFDFYSNGSVNWIFAAIFAEGEYPEIKIEDDIPSGTPPLYMRVRRTGDLWTLSYSYDGENWATPDGPSFTHALSVAKVGAFVGNAGNGSPPAHTGYIDYFFNSAAPVVPEDGDRNTLTVNPVGNGMVTKEPAPPYDCGDLVTLTAYADPGWTFAGWSGDLSGKDNPAIVTMTGDRVITATFTQDENKIFLPIITRQY